MTTHSETRRVPYTPRQMYDLVAAVDQYPEFLPWVTGARIRERRAEGDCEVMEADLIVSFKLFREKYGSRVELRPPETHEPARIDVENIDGPFETLVTRYAFHEAPEGCDMAFHVEFAFSNALMQRAAGYAFGFAMKSVVKAFEKRAAQIYG